MNTKSFYALSLALVAGAVSALAATTAVLSPSGQVADGFGHAVVGVGDVTSDSWPDFAVAAPFENTPIMANAGRVYLFNGRTGALLRALISPNPAPNGNFGFALALTTDMDNDGINDVVVGAPGERIDGENLGRVHLYSGATGVRIRSFNAFDAGILAGRSFEYGTAVAFYGDANGDSVPDFVVGAPGWSILEFGIGQGFRTPGRAFLVDGKDGSRLRDFVAPNLEVEGSFGAALAVIGDVDGDGFPDVVVGAPADRDGQVRAGRAYVFSGRTGQQLYSLSSRNPVEGGRFGAAVRRIEDLNGDGRDDIVVTADNERAGTLQAVGRVYIFSGATGSHILTINSPNPNELMFFGNDVDVIEDFNGDGLQDLVIAAGSAVRFKQAPAPPLRAFIVSSVSGTVIHPLTVPAPQGTPLFGSSAAGIGDVDGDGKEDIVLASTFSQGNVVARAYIVRSRDFAPPPPPPPSIDCSGRGREHSGSIAGDAAVLGLAILGLIGARIRRWRTFLG
jgi:hypothetical protein